MRIISKKKIRAYAQDNTQAKLALTAWYFIMRESSAKSLNELRKKFNNSIDSVGIYTIFNISGNNYRLITAIHYNRQCCYIREIWTHAEYSKPYTRST